MRRGDDIRAVDLFCGAGGSSWGARAAGARIVAGIDSSAQAEAVYRTNFPEAKFFRSRLEDMNLPGFAIDVGQVDLLLGSPECTNHSPAKGAGPRCEKSKATAFQVIRFARSLRPRWIVVENVVSMRRWSRFEEFKGGLHGLGYDVREQVLEATDFGVPQTRRRLFLLCSSAGAAPFVIGRSARRLSAEQVIDRNGVFNFSPLHTARRARATLERADRAIETIGENTPFLLVYYGTDHAGGWQDLERPLRTVTTVDRFAYVKPAHAGHMIRMLQVPELKAAMGMPIRFRIDEGSRRSRIHLIGNAVCPPVMRAVVRRLLAR